MEEGVKPGTNKLKAISKATPPASMHEIWQFLGLCNFFHTHVHNFAQFSSHDADKKRLQMEVRGSATIGLDSL